MKIIDKKENKCREVKLGDIIKLKISETEIYYRLIVRACGKYNMIDLNNFNTSYINPDFDSVEEMMEVFAKNWNNLFEIISGENVELYLKK